jgi:hypothetical protein
MMNIYTALNLTALAKDGPLNGAKMKRDRSWISSQIGPFGSNMQIQCGRLFKWTNYCHIQHY